MPDITAFISSERFAVRLAHDREAFVRGATAAVPPDIAQRGFASVNEGYQRRSITSWGVEDIASFMFS